MKLTAGVLRGNTMKKVITYGTFDLFHEGHYNILKRAKALGDYLIVGVTSESYDIERGKLNVRDSLLKRIENVRRAGFADEIIIEEYQGQKLSDIIKYKVDLLVLGSDWRGKFDYLKNYCDVVYLERTKNISSTKLRGEGTTYTVGVVTDNDQDNGIVWETKYVSGLHVECVFSENAEAAESFCDKYELESYYSVEADNGEWQQGFDCFLSQVDIVYIKTEQPKREKYIRRSLELGKYVISDAPMTDNKGKLKDLFALAAARHVLLVEKINLVYLRAFNQLVWQTHSALVGDIVCVKCSISQDHFEGGRSFSETAVLPLCAIIKILGRNYQEVNSNVVKDRSGNCIYDMITMKYQDALATIEIGTTVDVEDEFVVIGTKGRVTIPGDWWNTGYFEAKIDDSKGLKRYCFNFEGNGLRYLLQELLIMISDERTECTRLFNEESETLADILEIINQRG